MREVNMFAIFGATRFFSLTVFDHLPTGLWNIFISILVALYISVILTLEQNMLWCYFFDIVVLAYRSFF